MFPSGRRQWEHWTKRCDLFWTTKACLDTDLFGIANPEGEMMKLDKLSPLGLKTQTQFGRCETVQHRRHDPWTAGGCMCCTLKCEMNVNISCMFTTSTCVGVRINPLILPSLLCLYSLSKREKRYEPLHLHPRVSEDEPPHYISSYTVWLLHFQEYNVYFLCNILEMCSFWNKRGLLPFCDCSWNNSSARDGAEIRVLSNGVQISTDLMMSCDWSFGTYTLLSTSYFLLQLKSSTAVTSLDSSVWSGNTGVLWEVGTPFPFFCFAGGLQSFWLPTLVIAVNK